MSTGDAAKHMPTYESDVFVSWLAGVLLQDITSARKHGGGLVFVRCLDQLNYCKGVRGNSRANDQSSSRAIRTVYLKGNLPTQS